MDNLDKWIPGHVLTREEEPEYVKDLCSALREQETLSNPEKREDGSMVCSVVPDELAAHAADVIEEFFERIQNLEHELKEMR